MAAVSTVVALVSIVYLVAYHLYMLALIVGSAWEIRRQRRLTTPPWERLVEEPDLLPGVAVIVPAFNEETTIRRTVESLLALHYPELEIIVVNDGSTDRTLSLLMEAFDLWPTSERPEPVIATQNVRVVLRSRLDARLRVVDKRNGGKADALNAGIALTSQPLVCAVDADVVMDRTALLHLALAYVEDPLTVAAGGTVHLHNGSRIEAGRVVQRRLPRRLLERLQFLEFTRSMIFGRLMFNRLNAHLIVSGAFGLFSRDLLVELGGYQPYAIGEDIELVIRMHRHLKEAGRPYRIHFVARARCFTEGPGSLRELGKQRMRWHQGLLTSVRLHRKMMFRPRYGAVGMVSIPLFLLFELLSPVIEVVGWVTVPVAFAMGWLSGHYLLLFLLAATLFGACVSVAAVLFDGFLMGSLPRLRDRISLGLCSLLENLGYHQALLYYRLQAFPQYYRSLHIKGGWTPPARLRPERGKPR